MSMLDVVLNRINDHILRTGKSVPYFVVTPKEFKQIRAELSKFTNKKIKRKDMVINTLSGPVVIEESIA